MVVDVNDCNPLLCSAYITDLLYKGTLGNLPDL